MNAAATTPPPALHRLPRSTATATPHRRTGRPRRPDGCLPGCVPRAAQTHDADCFAPLQGLCYLGGFALEEFDRLIAATNDPRRGALESGRRLHGLDLVLDSAAWHLNQGSLRPGDADVLNTSRTNAAEDVAGRLGALVDGLAVPPGRAGGFIGRDDYISRIAALLA